MNIQNIESARMKFSSNENFTCAQISKLTNLAIKDNNDLPKNIVDTLKLPIIKIQKLHWCRQCRREFKTAQSLKDHIDTHGNFVCDICFEGFVNISNLNSHKTEHLDEKPYVCKTCGKRFIEPSILNIHMAFHTGERPFDCGVYTKKTTYRNIPKSEEKPLEEGKKTYKYKCKVCEKGLSSPSSLRAHILSHLGVKPYECDICQMRLSSKPALKSHIYIHANKKPFFCNVCSKSFRKLDYLKYHKRIHLTRRPYHCDECNKGYSRLHDLRLHMSYHTGVRPFECTICKQGFLRKKLLTIHMYNHENHPIKKKPFECGICNKKLTCYQDMKAHVFAHKNPLNCKICGRRFASKYHLSLHIRGHTGERPFDCNICKKKFQSKRSLKEHEKTHNKPYKHLDDKSEMNKRRPKLEKEMQNKENGDLEFQEELCLKTMTESENSVLVSMKKELCGTLGFNYEIQFEDNIKMEPKELLHEVNEM